MLLSAVMLRGFMTLGACSDDAVEVPARSSTTETAKNRDTNRDLPAVRPPILPTQIERPAESGGRLWDEATQNLADGIYYTTANIDLSAVGLAGAVTLVTDPPAGSGMGVVRLSGSFHELRPYTDGILVFTNRNVSASADDAKVEAAVSMSGSTQF